MEQFLKEIKDRHPAEGYILSIISLVELSSRIIFALILSGYIGAACIWWNEPFAWGIVVVGVYLYYLKFLRKNLHLNYN